MKTTPYAWTMAIVTALAGTPVEGVLGWAPASGDCPMTITIFSYNGRVHVGFGVDFNSSENWAMFSTNAVFPMEGRAATITRRAGPRSRR